MATDYHFFKGKAKWCRGQAPDQYGNWKVTLYPVKEDLAKVYELQKKGLKNVIGKDDDGEYITFRRPQQKVYKGKVKGFAPPEILNPDGTPFRELVGNGSDVTVKVEVYPYKSPAAGPGIAARWASMRVDNLVPYIVSRDFEADQEGMVRNLKDQPEPLF